MSNLLIKETVSQLYLLTPAEISDLKSGVYSGVLLLGYDMKGDTPAPIEYYLTNTAADPDDGSIFTIDYTDSMGNTQSIKLEHDFKEGVHPMYYGINGTHDDTDKINKIFKKFSKISGQGSGTMKIGRAINIPDNGILEGCTVYITNYQNCYIASGNNTIVRDNTFYGTGAKLASNTNSSCCLYFWRVQDIFVSGNSFYNFKALDHNAACGIITIQETQGARVENNYFDDSNFGFIDIGAGTISGNCIFTNNTSYSNSDIFISLASGGKDVFFSNTNINKMSDHIVSGNIHIKNRWATNSDPLGRHGVLVHYAGGISRMIATGNIIGNTARHGFYLRGTDNKETVPGTGDDIISGNTILYCGRGDISNYCSGIKLENTFGGVVADNIISYSGYDLNGTKTATYEAFAIECVRGMNNIVIEGNKIDHYRDGAIRLSVQNSERGISNVNVCNNIINGNVSAISLHASAPNNYIEKINISGNIVTVDTGSCFYTETQSDTQCTGGISVIDNTFSSTDKVKNNRGISLDMYGLLLLKPSIMHNKFINLNKGIASFREAGNNVENFPHRTFGIINTVDHNEFRNCKLALDISRWEAQRLAIVGINNRFSDNEATGITHSLDVNILNRVNLGYVYAYDSDQNPMVRVIALCPLPGKNVNVKGDIVDIFQPIEHMGWICVDPIANTWKKFGTIEP
ncbi:hypothetical protein [Chryseobacterium arthrosphaerae]|uniref:hypothetical protein n=1 Tax=Chryseobacterium arthrosphaerae TaxID=651561 RepID=UPI001E46E61D|nr:hypothetical protein [Chryseobacterium arthrosphaerae]UEQ77637.1 hypothetical protein J8N07_04845 [Chryseobacterium arthrosphaerae]